MPAWGASSLVPAVCLASPRRTVTALVCACCSCPGVRIRTWAGETERDRVFTADRQYMRMRSPVGDGRTASGSHIALCHTRTRGIMSPFVPRTLPPCNPDPNPARVLPRRLERPLEARLLGPGPRSSESPSPVHRVLQCLSPVVNVPTSALSFASGFTVGRPSSNFCVLTSAF